MLHWTDDLQTIAERSAEVGNTWGRRRVWDSVLHGVAGVAVVASLLQGVNVKTSGLLSLL